jgi:hypothetical protein
MDNSLTCQACAYWVQVKGNYGQCEGRGKKYDGSKKGSACIGYRESNNNINQLYIKKVYKPNSVDIKVPEYKSLRGLYNSLHKPKFKATHATNVDGEFVTFTSDIHCKNGYYRHRYNYTIIDVALTLFLQGKTFNEIAQYMKENYMKPPCRRTFRTWVIKFLGQNAWDSSNCSEVFLMCIKDKEIMVKNGKTRGGRQEFKCKKCKRRVWGN